MKVRIKHLEDILKGKEWVYDEKREGFLFDNGHFNFNKQMFKLCGKIIEIKESKLEFVVYQNWKFKHWMYEVVEEENNENKTIPYINCWVATDQDDDSFIYFEEQPYRDFEIWNTVESLYFRINNFFGTSWDDEEPTQAVILRKDDFKKLLKDSEELKRCKSVLEKHKVIEELEKSFPRAANILVDLKDDIDIVEQRNSLAGKVKLLKKELKKLKFEKILVNNNVSLLINKSNVLEEKLNNSKNKVKRLEKENKCIHSYCDKLEKEISILNCRVTEYEEINKHGLKKEDLEITKYYVGPEHDALFYKPPLGVQIKHIPTGIIVKSHGQIYQTGNIIKAFELLQRQIKESGNFNQIEIIKNNPFYKVGSEICSRKEAEKGFFKIYMVKYIAPLVIAGRIEIFYSTHQLKEIAVSDACSPQEAKKLCQEFLNNLEV